MPSMAARWWVPWTGASLVAGIALWLVVLRRRRCRVMDVADLTRELESKGFFVVDGLLGEATAAGLRRELRALRSSMAAGKLQHGLAVDTNAVARGDLVLLFDEGDHPAQSPTLSAYFALMGDLLGGLEADGDAERVLRGRVERCKFLCSCYPGATAPGARYVKHRDAWPPRPGRKLTLVYYANEAWEPAHGGQLRIWPEDGSEPVDVAPVGDRLVGFCAWLEHEVLGAFADRYALTTWLYNERDSVLEVVADQLKRRRSARATSTAAS